MYIVRTLFYLEGCNNRFVFWELRSHNCVKEGVERKDTGAERAFETSAAL